MDLQKQRELLDRDITFFHFGRARKRIARAVAYARRHKELFFVYYFFSQAAMLRSRFQQAIGYLNKGLALRPDDGCAYNDKALCLAELRQYSRALACFDEGLHRESDCVSLVHNKGWLLNTLGRHKEAIFYFRKALEMDADRPESWFSLADSYDNIGRASDALRYFKQAETLLRGTSSIGLQETRKRIRMLKTM